MAKKKIVVLIGCMFCMLTAKTQQYEVDDLTQSVFLYPDFYQGKVVFKNKSVQQALFNYNSLFQQMIYVQGGVLLALDKVNAIDTVYINAGAFIPVDSFFYEVRLAKGPLPLFIKYDAELTIPAPATPFGGTSQTGAVQNVASYRLTAATPYQLKVPENYTVRKTVSYYIKAGGRFVQLKGSKQVKQLYPANEKQLDQFMRENHTGFKNTPDMEKLVSFIGAFSQ